MGEGEIDRARLLGKVSEPCWVSTMATYLPAQPLVDALVHTVHHRAGASLLQIRDVVVLASWAVGGLPSASILFRWEPHRPLGTRPCRARQREHGYSRSKCRGGLQQVDLL